MHKTSKLLDKPEKPLTERQKKFVDDVMTGKTTEKHGNIGRAAQVQKALAEARSEITTVTTLTRMDVIDGIMEGINMAKMMAEPATMIKGWVEVGRILGLDAPDPRKKALSTNADMLQTKLLNMTTAELLELAAGNMPPIEGEAQRVE